MKYFLCCLLVFLVSAAKAEGEWTPTQEALAASYAALLVVDRSQTTYGVQHGFYERNPVMGRAPSKGRINVYFAGVAVASAIGLTLLSAEYRTPTLIVLTTVELLAVGNNAKIGIHMKF